MATVNPFDLLGDDDNDDVSHLIAIQQQKAAAAAAAAKKAAAEAPPPAAKVSSKPLPQAQAGRGDRGYGDRGERGGYGRGRGGRGGNYGNREFGNVDADGFTGGYGGGARGEEGDVGQNVERERGGYGAPRGAFRGGRRGGYGYGAGNGDVGEGGGGGGGYDRPARRVYEQDGGSDRPARRTYERHSGTDRGYGMKREGAGRGNWGSTADDALAQEVEEIGKTDEKIALPEKNLDKEDAPVLDATNEGKTNETEEKEEDKEMTLEEYEKVREEKRKALLALKTEERKVVVDKEFESMQQLSLKKENDGDIFIKLGAEKEGKKKENADRDERAKKVSIQQFLKPAEGERYYNPSGRGRGRGRGGDRAPFRGGAGGGGSNFPAAAPPIEDPGHFPTLGGK